MNRLSFTHTPSFVSGRLSVSLSHSRSRSPPRYIFVRRTRVYLIALEPKLNIKNSSTLKLYEKNISPLLSCSCNGAKWVRKSEIIGFMVLKPFVNLIKILLINLLRWVANEEVEKEEKREETHQKKVFSSLTPSSTRRWRSESEITWRTVMKSYKV